MNSMYELLLDVKVLWIRTVPVSIDCVFFSLLVDKYYQGVIQKGRHRGGGGHQMVTTIVKMT